MHTQNSEFEISLENLVNNSETSTQRNSSFASDDMMAYVKITIMLISIVISLASCFFTVGETTRTIVRHCKHKKSTPPSSSVSNREVFISPEVSITQ